MKAAWKAFATGPADVLAHERGDGHDRSNFAVPKHQEYIATCGAVYACSSLRARNIAGLPLKLYKLVKGEKVEVTSGRMYDLLAKVNPFWTWNRLIQMTELSLCGGGEACWVLERGPSGKGVPTEAWWVRADRMKPVIDPAKYLVGWWYEHNGVRLYFEASEVIWFRYPNPLDEFSGLSPIAAARLSIDTGHAALRSNRKIFENGSQIAGIVSPSDKETNWTKDTVDALTLMFDRRFKGVDKAHRLAVLGQSAKIESASISPKDAQFIELMRWSKGDVAMVYLTPPELIGDHEHATYSNIDQAYKGFWTDCLVPEVQMLAAELTEQLAPMFGDEVDLVEFDTSGVTALQEDQAELTTQAMTYWQMGVPLNRVLQVYAPRLLPPGKDGFPWGDEPGGTLPAVVDATPAALPAPEDPPPATPAEAAERALKALRALRGQRKAYQPVEYGSDEHKAKATRFGRRADRHQARIKAEATRLLELQRDGLIARLRGEKGVTVKDDDGALWDSGYWNEVFAENIVPFISAAAQDAGDTTIDDLSIEIDFDVSRPEVAEFLAQRAQRFAEEVNATTWAAVQETLNAGREAGEGIDQLAARIEQVMGDRIRSSAETIARTETAGALNAGSLLAAKASGVVKGKGWLASLDGRERETHGRAHERYQKTPIPLDEDFEVGAGKGPAPGQIGLAEEDCNCRCSLTFEVMDDDEDEDGETRTIPSTVAEGIRQWLERTGS